MPIGHLSLSIKWLPRQAGPTEQVWDSSTRAAESPLTHELVIEYLIQALRRTLNSLASQKRREHQTSCAEALTSDTEAMARAMYLLKGERTNS
jgi:hypothetical protein